MAVFSGAGERQRALASLLVQGHQSHAGAPSDLIEPCSPAKAHLQPQSQGVRAPALEGAPLRPLREVTVSRPWGAFSLGGGSLVGGPDSTDYAQRKRPAGVGRLEAALQRAQRLHVWRAVSRTGVSQLCVSGLPGQSCWAQRAELRANPWIRLETG